MNGDLIPAVVAAGGGTTMVAGIWLHEHRRDESMRAERVRLSLRFPIGLEPPAAFAALDGLSGLSHSCELVAEVAASEGSIAHFLWVPESVRASVQSTMVGVIPSLRITHAPPVPGEATTLALRLFVPWSVLSSESAAAASRSLLAGLAGLRGGEQVIIRWALRPGSPRPRREAEAPSRRVRELEKAWRRKTAVPGFAASGLVLVRAQGFSRARELAAHIEAVLRSRRGLAGGVRVTSERGNRRLSAMPRTTRTSGWLSNAELLALVAWPFGPDVVAGVEVGASRELAAGRHVPREGRRLFIGRDSGGERPVALSAEASRLHLGVVAPTGGGKSVLLARCILDDLARGYGGVLLDPKNDLVGDLLDRIPARHADRMVVLDPAAAGPVPGLNLFGGGDADVRSDMILTALRGIFRDAWGVRIDSYLRLGLRTVAELPNPALSDWLRLYSDPALRRRAVGRLRDPMLVGQWRTYESLSAAEQFQHVTPALSRIVTLLSRPALRAVINQPAPKLDVGRLLAERKWLLVSLAPGTLGEAASQLLGAITTYLVWSAIEARVAIAPEKRHPVFLYCDELQSLVTLPVGLELFFERTRGLGCGVVVATQALARLPEATRQAMLANVGSLITFSAGADEAARLARELPGLSAADIMGLGRYEVAARISTGELGSGTAVVTGRTEGPAPVTGQADVIRARSAAVYGTDPREVERELARRITDEPDEDDDGGQLGRTGRVS